MSSGPVTSSDVETTFSVHTKLDEITRKMLEQNFNTLKTIIKGLEARIALLESDELGE